MKLRKSGVFLTLAMLSFGLAGGQNLYHHKDLAFAQVAVGPTIETVITLTNRAVFPYSGRLKLSRGSNGVSWNPVVNGQPVVGGEVEVRIEVDQTITLLLTQAPGNPETEAGAALLQADDLFLDNFVEANLTYFVRTGGEIVDSVGVPPTQEFYLASLPFQEFSRIGLALANLAFDTLQTASVRISLLDEDGGDVLDFIDLELRPFAHQAQFLTELFPGIALQKGKIEISSINPLVGTALTLTNGELSTLPLLASPSSYEARMVADDGTVVTGQLALWVEGFFVRGYLVITKINDTDIDEPSLVFVNGQLRNRFLDLTFFAVSTDVFGDIYPEAESVGYFLNTDFGLEQTTAAGSWTFLFLSDRTTLTGSYSLTRWTP